MTEPEHEKERLRRIKKIYALRDFGDAITSAKYLSKIDPSKRYSWEEMWLFRSVECMLAVSYARPFTKTPGMPSLSLKMCRADLSDEEMKIHKEIIDLRNREHAHTDAKNLRMSASSSVAHTEPKEIWSFEPLYPFQPIYLGQTVEPVEQLILHVARSLTSALFEELQKHPDRFNIDWHPTALTNSE